MPCMSFVWQAEDGWSMSFTSFVKFSWSSHLWWINIIYGISMVNQYNLWNFRANRIWCSGSKAFLTAVEDEPHELRSDKESPLAKGSCNWCHHVVNQNQIKKWSNLHCFMDPPCCFNFNKFTICTWYVMSFFICTMYNIGSWGQSKSLKLQGLRAFGPSSNSTSTLSFDEAPRTCRGLKPTCSILFHQGGRNPASPKGWLKPCKKW